MPNTQKIRETFEKKDGVFKLIPIFVPRRFSKPGRRLRLHPDDYFAFGTKRGAIKERWFSSVINCMNGPETLPDEGLSYVSCSDDPSDKFTLREAVETMGGELIGEELIEKYGTWPMYSKFFDYAEPLFHHVHLMFEDAKRVGRLGKPEAYYYPPQYNNYAGTFPHTYFGFSPDVTKEEVLERLKQYKETDTRITELSRAFRIQLGTGWYTPAGVIHAPGSYLTYEPQWNSDVNSVYENVTSGEINPYDMLVENCPEDKQEDMEYVLSLLDWDKNVDPNYRKTYYRPPITMYDNDQATLKWVTYGNEYIAASELTVKPGQTVTVKDDYAYGCILTQGYGKFGSYSCATPTLLRFGQLSEDEFYVSAPAAKKGVEITNLSNYENLVILRHFPANAQTPEK